MHIAQFSVLSTVTIKVIKRGVESCTRNWYNYFVKSIIFPEFTAIFLILIIHARRDTLL